MEIETYIKSKFKDLEKLIDLRFDENAKQHETLKEELNKKASKWVQAVVSTGIGVILLWGLNQLLDLITKANAIFFN